MLHRPRLGALLILALALALLAACSPGAQPTQVPTTAPTSTPQPQPQPQPTTTPEPTDTPEPTATATTVPTEEPTATPEPEPTVAADASADWVIYTNPREAFSFEHPASWELSTEDDELVVFYIREAADSLSGMLVTTYASDCDPDASAAEALDCYAQEAQSIWAENYDVVLDDAGYWDDGTHEGYYTAVTATDPDDGEAVVAYITTLPSDTYDDALLQYIRYGAHANKRDDLRLLSDITASFDWHEPTQAAGDEVWVTYENETAGFALAFPETWELLDEDDESVYLGSPDLQAFIGVGTVRTLCGMEKSDEATLDCLVEDNLAGWSDDNQATLLDAGTWEDGEHSGYAIIATMPDTESDADVAAYSLYFLTDPTEAVTVTFLRYDAQELTEEDIELLANLSATLSWSDSTTTILDDGWLTYTSQDGTFQLSLPDTWSIDSEGHHEALFLGPDISALKVIRHPTSCSADDAAQDPADCLLDEVLETWEVTQDAELLSYGGWDDAEHQGYYALFSDQDADTGTDRVHCLISHLQPEGYKTVLYYAEFGTAELSAQAEDLLMDISASLDWPAVD